MHTVTSTAVGVSTIIFLCGVPVYSSKQIPEWGTFTTNKGNARFPVQRATPSARLILVVRLHLIDQLYPAATLRQKKGESAGWDPCSAREPKLGQGSGENRYQETARSVEETAFTQHHRAQGHPTLSATPASRYCIYCGQLSREFSQRGPALGLRFGSSKKIERLCTSGVNCIETLRPSSSMLSRHCRIRIVGVGEGDVFARSSEALASLHVSIPTMGFRSTIHGSLDIVKRGWR